MGNSHLSTKEKIDAYYGPFFIECSATFEGITLEELKGITVFPEVWELCDKWTYKSLVEETILTPIYSEYFFNAIKHATKDARKAQGNERLLKQNEPEIKGSDAYWNFVNNCNDYLKYYTGEQNAKAFIGDLNRSYLTTYHKHRNYFLALKKEKEISIVNP